ncbi:uncharacterized protein LOC120284190 [Drosophila simulans]|uniref:Uncharacterized protein n=1 Tax=Drosophila simulans TaxID=7240 RepID=A0A0J9RDC6_DROSI|nr:uncharacterized protein LOC120284190 [Drosophila simulans]KMY94058.1 uncharacterized protein Dsimw501_GD29106 [Drosophila simulans]
MEHIRFVAKVFRAVIAGTLLLLMTAIYREDNYSGSHYIHPRHAMQ